ncbi:MAG TPA: hypothetical protein PK993_03980 [Clostridia bacterium]|nr:hypothetical protein [Clostridia bacterium]
MIKEKINAQKDTLIPIYTPNKEKDLLKSLTLISICLALGFGSLIFIIFWYNNPLLAIFAMQIVMLIIWVIKNMHNIITIKL